MRFVAGSNKKSVNVSVSIRDMVHRLSDELKRPTSNTPSFKEQIKSSLDFSKACLKVPILFSGMKSVPSAIAGWVCTRDNPSATADGTDFMQAGHEIVSHSSQRSSKTPK